MNQNGDKKRFYFGLFTIFVVISSSILLLWQKKDFQEKINRINLSEDVTINNLQKENQDLKNKIIQLQASIQSTNANQTKTTSTNNNGKVAGVSSQQSQLININTAGASELDKLPGIGATRAQQIIDYRNANGIFQKPEDIMKVSGIGQATYDKMKSMITTE